MEEERGPDNSGPTKTTRAKASSRKTGAGYRIEERDLRLLQDLYTFSLLSRDQILRMGHFGSVSRLNRRMGILRRNGFVSTHVPPFARSGGQFLYALARNGIRLVADRLGLDVSEVRRDCRPDESPMSWEHTIAIGDVWIALHENVAGQKDIQIERWLPERDARMEFEVRAGGGTFRTCVVRPDAFVRLRWRGLLLPAFLEIDRGHVSQAKWQAKAKSFETYLASGLFAEDFGQEKFVVLVVTTTKKRLVNLLSPAQNTPISFLGTTFADLDAGVLGPIWYCAAGGAPTALAEGIAEGIGAIPADRTE